MQRPHSATDYTLDVNRYEDGRFDMTVRPPIYVQAVVPALKSLNAPQISSLFLLKARKNNKKS